MRILTAIILMICLTGCATKSAVPMMVGSSYQIRLAESEDVSQVRVIEASDDWLRIKYNENSPRVDSGLDEVWVNAEQIVWFVPYE